MTITYRIDAFWDADAHVWVAISDDVPGLATEADTMEALLVKLRTMVPELLHENSADTQLPDRIPYNVIVSDTALVHVQCLVAG